MDNEVPHKDLRSEVLRRIGRNVLLLQQLERNLKFLVAAQRLAGPFTELVARRQRRVEEVGRHTLGQLAGQFHDSFYGPTSNTESPSTTVTELAFSISISLEGEPQLIESSKSDLASVVEERNKLVHDFSRTWDLKSVSSCDSANEWLDKQQDGILSQISKYRVISNELASFMKELQSFLDSDAGKHLFEEKDELPQ